MKNLILICVIFLVSTLHSTAQNDEKKLCQGPTGVWYYYCETAQYWQNKQGTDDYSQPKKVMLADNTSFIPYLGYSARFKKGTYVSFNYVLWDKKIDREGDNDYVKALNTMDNGMSGTISSGTIDGNTNTVAWGCHLLINIPDGSEITFSTSLIKDLYRGWECKNAVSEVVLGADANIPGLGLLKKGTKFGMKDVSGQAQLSEDWKVGLEVKN